MMKPQHIRAIAEGEIAGLSRSEMAARTGLTPRTISRYRRRPEVLEAVERLATARPDARAVDVLQHLLQSADERIRLEAAKELLRRYAILLK